MRVLSWDVGLRTLSYCVLDVDWVDGPIVQVIRWEIVDVKSEFVFPLHVKPQTGKNKDKLTLEQNVLAVLQALERRSDLMELELDAVTIEQQPAGGQNRFSNVNMKVISCVIQSYFVMRLGQDFLITFVSPSSKLVELRALEKEEKKQGLTDTEELTPEQRMRKRYKRNKSFAIEKTLELLVDDEPALGILNAAGRKKDDLCDAFLLGYYFALKHVQPKARKKRKTTVPASNQTVIDLTQRTSQVREGQELQTTQELNTSSLASFFSSTH